LSPTKIFYRAFFEIPTFFIFLVWKFIFEFPNPVLGSKDLFLPFWPQKLYFFLLQVKFPISHDHTNFGPQIPFLWGPIYVFWPPKFHFFLLHVKFSIDGYIMTMSILIFCPKIRFWALKAYFRIFTSQKYIFSSSLTYLIFEPPVPSLRIRPIPIFFGLRTLSIKFQLFCVFRFLKFGLVLALDVTCLVCLKSVK
jgi:hypothetical protein